jgi:hypothetical protein
VGREDGTLVNRISVLIKSAREYVVSFATGGCSRKVPSLIQGADLLRHLLSFPRTVNDPFLLLKRDTL